MPAKSQSQQRYFGWLYSKKKSGDTSGLDEKDKKVMEGMSKKQIRDFAATKRKGLPVAIQKEAGVSQAVNKLMNSRLVSNAMRNDLVRHVGGGAIVGAPLGAAYKATMGNEWQTLGGRVKDGLVRGAIGGGSLGLLYHLGRKHYNIPRLKEMIGNRVPRA